MTARPWEGVCAGSGGSTTVAFPSSILKPFSGSGLVFSERLSVFFLHSFVFLTSWDLSVCYCDFSQADFIAYYFSLQHASSDVERMILGNKCDMNDKRQVSKERGEKLAIDYGIKFLETSAKSSTNVEEAFFTLARDIMTKLNRKMNDSNSSGAGGPVKITENRSKKTSFFRCSLL